MWILNPDLKHRHVKDLLKCSTICTLLPFTADAFFQRRRRQQQLLKAPKRSNVAFAWRSRRQTEATRPLIKSYKQIWPHHNSCAGLLPWLIPIHTYCLITIMCFCGENTSGRGVGGVGEGGRLVGGLVGGAVVRRVNNKWPGLHLIGSDFNPMFHHRLVHRGECLGFGLSITDMCRQADTIISLIVTSPAQWHQEVIHQSISCDTAKRDDTPGSLELWWRIREEGLFNMLPSGGWGVGGRRILMQTFNLSRLAIALDWLAACIHLGGGARSAWGRWWN